MWVVSPATGIDLQPQTRAQRAASLGRQREGATGPGDDRQRDVVGGGVLATGEAGADVGDHLGSHGRFGRGWSAAAITAPIVTERGGLEPATAAACARRQERPLGSHPPGGGRARRLTR